MTWQALQIEINAQYRRATLIREAEHERLASLLRSANTRTEKPTERPRRTGLAALLPRLAGQVS
jgi:hypothetical protein